VKAHLRQQAENKGRAGAPSPAHLSPTAREENGAEIGTLHAEAEQIAEEARELAGEVSF
jgi:hypothetical protein